MARAAIASKPSAGPSAAEMRAELRRRDEEFRRQRGAAVLDGKNFDPAPLAAVQQELQALDDVEAEATRRAAEAAAKAHAERVAAVRERVAALDAARLAALAAAEQAAGAMMKALVEYRDGCAAIVAEMSSLGPAVPASLLPQAVGRRLGDLIAAALFPVRTDAYSLGNLEWHTPNLQPVADWPGVDRALTERDVAATIDGNAKNG